jgi:hypothetical protein
LGEVYRPEDLVGGKKKPSDLSPLPRGIVPSLEEVICEVRLLKAEVDKIKQALKAKGIILE